MIIHRVEHNRRRLRMHVHVCESGVERTRGLLLRRCPDQQTAFLLRRCSAVHTLGMMYPIDVIFCDATGRILCIQAKVRPWRFVSHPDARSVWELRAGVTEQLGWKEGDWIAPC
jgi:uncharacterized membrane protein (UPF0127 family)